MIDWKGFAKQMRTAGFDGTAAAAQREADIQEAEEILDIAKHGEDVASKILKLAEGPEIEDYQVTAIRATRTRELAEKILARLKGLP